MILIILPFFPSTSTSFCGLRTPHKSQACFESPTLTVSRHIFNFIIILGRPILALFGRWQSPHRSPFLWSFHICGRRSCLQHGHGRIPRSLDGSFLPWSDSCLDVSLDWKLRCSRWQHPRRSRFAQIFWEQQHSHCWIGCQFVFLGTFPLGCTQESFQVAVWQQHPWNLRSRYQGPHQDIARAWIYSWTNCSGTYHYLFDF